MGERTPPTWDAVLQHEYEAWTTSRLVIDSALVTASEAAQQVLAEIARPSRAQVSKRRGSEGVPLSPPLKP